MESAVTQLLSNRIQAVLQRFSEEKFCGAEAFLRKVEPVIQEGPQCGLVALLMSANALSLPGRKNLSDILELAKERGFTNRGEMFSAQWLCELATSLWPTVTCVVTELPTKRKLAELLVSGSIVLIPYDADKNHEPICLKGHKAHWCLVAGYVCPNKILDKVFWNQNVPKITDNLYVFALHGKSRHFAVWDYDTLVTSNSNLFEIGPQRLNDGQMYILPEEGLSALRCQCLILS